MEQKIKLGGAYESPDVNVIGLTIEGVLCESGTGSFGELVDGGDI